MYWKMNLPDSSSSLRDNSELQKGTLKGRCYLGCCNRPVSDGLPRLSPDGEVSLLIDVFFHSFSFSILRNNIP